MKFRDRLFCFCMPCAVFAGLLLGAASACRAETGALFVAAAESFASPALASESFLHALWQNGGLAVLLILLGTSLLGGLPMAFLLGLRAYAAGFAVSALVSAYGGRGFLAAVCGIFPHHLFYIPFLCLLAIHSVRFAVRLSDKKNSAPARLSSYLLSSLLLTLPIFLGCLVEGYISAPLLRAVLGAYV